MASSTIGLCTECSHSLFESLENDPIVTANPCGHLYHNSCFSRIFNQADGPPGDPLPPPCSAAECDSNMESSLTAKVKVMRVNLEAVASKSDEFVRLLQQQVHSSQVEMAKVKAELISSQFEVRDTMKKLERANSEAKSWKDKYDQLLATVKEKNPEQLNPDSKMQSLNQAPPNSVGNTQSVNTLGADMSVPPPVLRPPVPRPNLPNVPQPNLGPPNFPLRNIRPPLRLPLGPMPRPPLPRPPFGMPPPHLMKWPRPVEPPTVRGLLMRATGPPPPGTLPPKLTKSQRRAQRRLAKEQAQQAILAQEAANRRAEIKNLKVLKQAAPKQKLAREMASTNNQGAAKSSVRPPTVNQNASGKVVSEIGLPQGLPQGQKKNPEPANIAFKDQSHKKAPPVNNSRTNLSPIRSPEGQDMKDVIQPKMTPHPNVQPSSNVDQQQFDILPPWIKANPATSSVSPSPRNEMVDGSNSNGKQYQEDTRQHLSSSDTERRSANNWREETESISPDSRDYMDESRRYRSPSDSERRSETTWRAEPASVSPDSDKYHDDTRRHRNPYDTDRRSVSPDSRDYQHDTRRYRSPSDTERRFDAYNAGRKRARSRDSDSSVERLPYHHHAEEKDYGGRKYSKYAPTESVEQLPYRPRTRMRKKDYVGKNQSNYMPPEYNPQQQQQQQQQQPQPQRELGGLKYLPTDVEMYPFRKIEGLAGGFVQSRYQKVIGFFAARWLVIGEGTPQAAVSLAVSKKYNAHDLEQDATLLGAHLSMEELMNAVRSFVMLPPNIVMSVGCAELISGVEVDEMASLFDELVTLLLNRGVCDIVVTPPIFISDLQPLRREYIEVFRNYEPPRGLRYTYLSKLESLISSFKQKVDTKGRFCYSAANGRKFGRQLLLQLNKMALEIDSDHGSDGSARS